MNEAHEDDLLADVREQLAADIRSERRLVTPDFAAMVAAAHARNPEAVPASAVAEANSLAPVVEIGRASEDMLGEAALERLIAEARMCAEHDVHQRRLAGIPAQREAPALVAANDAGRARWLAPLLMLAAVLATLVLVGPRVMDSLAAARGGVGLGVEAEYLDQRERPSGDAHSRQRSVAPGGPRSTPVLRTVEAELPPPETADPADPADPASPADPVSSTDPADPASSADPADPADPASSAPRETKRADKRAQSPTPKLGDKVAVLDAEAQACWARGDLDGAEQRFRQILAIAGRSRHADLAYGDLFTLARQRRDRAAETALWGEYLGRFPRGRFAQDARAGRCRRADSDASSCWQDYMQDFPEGLHLREAERALEGSAP